jgi:hypothetical protein
MLYVYIMLYLMYGNVEIHDAEMWNNVHFQLAFDSVMLMWGKKPLKSYGARMSESMLAILRHILRGEKIMAVSWYCCAFCIGFGVPTAVVMKSLSSEI